MRSLSRSTWSRAKRTPLETPASGRARTVEQAGVTSAQYRAERRAEKEEEPMLTGIIVLAAAALVGVVGSIVTVARDGFHAIPTKTFTRWS